MLEIKSKAFANLANALQFTSVLRALRRSRWQLEICHDQSCCWFAQFELALSI
jgi:hypothetical protein